MQNPFRRNAGEVDPVADDGDDERSPRSRIILLSGLILLLLIVAFGSWLGIRAFNVKSDLEQARSDAQQVKDALLRGKDEDAVRAAGNAKQHAAGARDAAYSVPWRMVAAVPWLGSPFKTGQQISDVVVRLASDVLDPAAHTGSALSPDQLLDGNRVDVQLLRRQQPALMHLSTSAQKIDADAQKIEQPAYLSTLERARTTLQAQTADLAKVLGDTALAAELAPSMMGADGPRTYFMGFQTNAEARGTGGLLGGFGVLRFDNGVANVDDLGPNTELDKEFVPIDLGPDYADQYGFARPSTDYRNSNLSSHFPYAAEIWRSMWKQQSGTSVDGVIAIDPVALSFILEAIGPISLPDGEVVTRENVVELTESTAYQRFPTDQAARKQYLQNIANAVVRKMTSEKLKSPRDLLDALGKAVSQRRIAIWSATPKDQQLLEHTPLAHIIPDGPEPYAEVVMNNLAGNKMDYYLTRKIEYAADGCDGPMRNSTITIDVANTATAGASLPDYVGGSGGLSPEIPIRVKSGTMVTSIKLVATKGAELLTAISAGQRVPVIPGTDRGHPTFEVQVAIPPGKNGQVMFRLSEPTAPGEPNVPIQPLVDSVTPVVTVPACPR